MLSQKNIDIMPILFQKSKIALKTSKYIPQKNEKITQKNQNKSYKSVKFHVKQENNTKYGVKNPKKRKTPSKKYKSQDK